MSGTIVSSTRRRSSLPHVVDVASTVEHDVHTAIVIGIVALGLVVAVAAGPLAALSVVTLCGHAPPFANPLATKLTNVKDIPYFVTDKFHLVYTHVWLVSTMVAVCSGDGEWIGVLTAMGVAITVPWYGLLVLRRGDDAVGRILTGWCRWIVEDLLGCEKWPYDLHTVPRLLRVGYHIVDLAVHFLPTPWLLQRYRVTALDCMCAFLLSRLWSVSACALHLTVDWKSLRCSPPKLRVRARSQAITPFVCDGVLNDIYGLSPTIPRSSLRFLYTLEVATLLMIIVAPRSMYVGIIPPVWIVEGAMAACVCMGVICTLAGAGKVAIAMKNKAY